MITGILIGFVLGVASMLLLSYAIGSVTYKGRIQRQEDIEFLNAYMESKKQREVNE